MRYYPVFLDIKKRRCVVVGGGSVAERKVKGLISSGAYVVVISEEITAGLEEMKERGIIEHIKRNYVPGDLKGATLVIAATSDIKTNKKVSEEAKRLNIPVNVVDVPELCTFIVPSVVEKGPLCIAISTSGISPALSRTIRIELERYIPNSVSEYLKFLESERKRIKESLQFPALREEVLKFLGGEDVFRLLKEKGLKEAVQRAESKIEEVKEDFS